MPTSGGQPPPYQDRSRGASPLEAITLRDRAGGGVNIRLSARIVRSRFTGFVLSSHAFRGPSRALQASASLEPGLCLVNGAEVPSNLELPVLDPRLCPVDLAVL